MLDLLDSRSGVVAHLRKDALLVNGLLYPSVLRGDGQFTAGISQSCFVNI